MLLSDVDIKEALKKGDIVVEPFDPSLLGPDSLDLRLGNEILVSKSIGKTIDPKNPENFFEKIGMDESGFVLEPHQFILGTTLEKISLSNNIAAQIEGRSSMGRLGIMVHMTAGIIHSGFGSNKPSALTLEIYSVNPNSVLLYEGMKIAQISFFKLSTEVSQGYDSLPTSKYKGQDKPLPPKGEL